MSLSRMLCGGMVLLFLLAGIGLTSPSLVLAEPLKKAIVVVSFGTTFSDTRQESIEAVEHKIQAKFPDYEVRRAFTSNIVRKVMAEEQAIYTDSLDQALDKLRAEGFQEVIVQATHLTPGEEYDNKIVATVQKYTDGFTKIVIGRPLLTYDGVNGTPNDFQVAVEALKKQMPALQLRDRAVVFMGHGSPNQPNPAYAKLQQALDAAGLHAVIGVVEETDHPNFTDALALLKERGVQRVILMPLMLVAGDHAHNDMAGDEPDSWKNLLVAEGFTISEIYLRGLGANPVVQDIYVQHVLDAMDGR